MNIHPPINALATALSCCVRGMGQQLLKNEEKYLELTWSVLAVQLKAYKDLVLSLPEMMKAEFVVSSECSSSGMSIL